MPWVDPCGRLIWQIFPQRSYWGSYFKCRRSCTSAFWSGHAGAAAGCCLRVLLEDAAVRVVCALWRGHAGAICRRKKRRALGYHQKKLLLSGVYAGVILGPFWVPTSHRMRKKRESRRTSSNSRFLKRNGCSAELSWAMTSIHGAWPLIVAVTGATASALRRVAERMDKEKVEKLRHWTTAAAGKVELIWSFSRGIPLSTTYRWVFLWNKPSG